MASRNLVVYLAFGDKCIGQALYSLLTLADVYHHDLSVLKVVVYTDKPQRFAWLQQRFGIHTKLITPTDMAEWHGPNKQPLRAKIRVVQEALSDHAGNVLLLDSDTLIRKRLDGLFKAMSEGKVIMHRREYSVAVARKYNAGLCPEDFTIALPVGPLISVNDRSVMWNSGVIGLRSARAGLIDMVLELNDRMYAKYPAWHIEQLSYSLIWAGTGMLRGCPGYIFHYWSNKEVVEPYLREQEALPKEVSEARLSHIRGLKYRHMAKVLLKYHSRRLKEAFRDLPGVYRAFLILRQPFKRSRPGASVPR
jgi:hypothetical protein